MRIYLSAGEASGDRYAGALVRALSSEIPQARFEGVGGACLRAEGAQIRVDSSKWGAVSISQSLKQVPRAYMGSLKAIACLREGEPGLFIPIDFGFLNIKLARRAKSAGWKVLYFIPPGSWRRDRQGKDLPVVSDHIVTPFPWSAEILKNMGADAHWFGHPLKQLIHDTVVEDGPRKGIAVLPGSRKHELDLHLPLVATALADEPRSIEFALAPTASVEQIKARWATLAPNRKNDRFTTGATYGVLKRAEAAVVCSGTATLEAALCGCPTVVIYKLSTLMALEVAIVRPKIDFASLPNILLQRMAIPELLHTKATPENVRQELDRLLDQPEAREAQLQAFAEINDLLGPADAITQTAKLVRSQFVV